MNVFRDGREIGLGAMLRERLDDADHAHPGRTALYLAGLSDPRGLALARAVHKVLPKGADPLELRRRAEDLGLTDALVAGACRIDLLALSLESMEIPAPPDRRLLAWTMLELHRHGDVPVVMLFDGLALVAALDALIGEAGDIAVWGWGWPRPAGEA